MKRTALALILILLLLPANTLLFFICPVQADTSYIPYPAEPNQELPTLEVDSPKNGEVFTVTTVSLNFTVTKPDSWNEYWLTTMPVIGSYVVHIYLDGNLNSKYPLVDPGSTGFPTADYSVFLYRLARGGHSVKINVEAATYYDDPSPEPSDYLLYSRNITETIHFTVNADLPTPSPKPTSTPEPTPTPEPFPTILVIASVTIAIIGIGLLVYFKKRYRDKKL